MFWRPPHRCKNMSDAHRRLATDVGGTFTDLVSVATDPATGASTIRTAKVDTTPPDFEQGVMAVFARAGIMPSEVETMVHGTTVVINALTERKGVRVGLITTAGFRDTLEIARGNRPDFFNLHYEKPRPFVERHLRRELPGRMSYRGVETTKLELEELESIIADFRSAEVQAVAICFLHAYANPAHEQAALARMRDLCPELPAVASHQITREWREYERTSTTVLSAYVQPVAERYLGRLEDAMHSDGFNGSLYVMQSNCGVEALAAAAKVPITMIESGPASGVWGAAELGRLIDEPNILALDIGGTTAKCSLIEDGMVRIMTDYWIERTRRSAGYPIMVPVVDLVEIGNGGGSIAWVDDYGKLHVGPESAAAVPGPAAYGKGGTAATTTDANLCLGRINPDYFCGGEVQADMEAARVAVGKVGAKLGVDPASAARGIIRIANNNMINALKLVSLNRGHDPRDFTLTAFGGGGAMHAVALAQELGVKRVVIPAGAEVFSAWGMMMSDLRRDFFITRLTELNEEAAPGIEKLFSETEDQARKHFASEGIDPDKVVCTRIGKFRYQNQEHTTEVRISGAVTAASVATITAAFHTAYEREYTYRLDAPVEMVGIHLIAAAEAGKLSLQPRPPAKGDVEAARKGTRDVDYALEGVHEAAIYDGSLLGSGMRLSGPAVIEESGTTVVIHPDNQVAVDDYGNYHIDFSSGE